MHVTSRRDADTRRLQVIASMHDMELEQAFNANDVMARIVHGVADRVADVVMERLAPAIDEALKTLSFDEGKETTNETNP